MASEWNTGGFSFQWHVDQVAAGRRVLPCLKFPMSTSGDADSQSNNPTFVTSALNIAPASWALLKDNGLPICLRTDNVPNTFASLRYRAPKVLASIPPSPLVWNLVNGVLDDRFLIDSFGPVSNWTNEGTWWSQFLLTRSLEEKLPNPAYVVLVENNETAYEKNLARYTTVVANATNAVGLPLRAWKTSAVLATESLRMMDYVDSHPGVTPEQFLLTYWLQRKAHYRAAYQAFNNGMIPSWRGKLLTNGYKAMQDARSATPALHFNELGYAPELTYYDSGSEGLYSQGSTLVDFTSPTLTNFLNLIPAWEVARARNPNAWRELLLYFSNGAALYGARNGLHEIMTPARYEAYVEWLMWSIHEPGVPVMMRHWIGSATKPTDPMFDSTHYPDLDKYGASATKTATIENYVRPLMNVVDRAAGTALLREFWLHGKPVLAAGVHPSKEFAPAGYAPYPRQGDPDTRWRVLEVSTNPPRSSWTSTYQSDVKMKVWAVATQIGDQVLLYAWSPAKLTGNVQVTVPGFGTYSIAAPQPSGYWMIQRGSPAATRVL